MKRIATLLILMATIVVPSTAFAGYFDYGQNEQGLYYNSESQNLVYSRDASCLMDAQSAEPTCSTQWYVKLHNMYMPSAYFERIEMMNQLLNK